MKGKGDNPIMIDDEEEDSIEEDCSAAKCLKPTGNTLVQAYGHPQGNTKPKQDTCMLT